MAKLSPEVKAARAKRKKLKAPRVADWLAIRALYLGGMKSEEIGQKFGVTGNLIRARALDERWFEVALEQTPRMVVDKIMKQEAEATGAMLTEIWAERGRLIREKEFRIAEKAATHAEMMDYTTLLNKIDKVKVQRLPSKPFRGGFFGFANTPVFLVGFEFIKRKFKLPRWICIECHPAQESTPSLPREMR